MVWSEGQMVKGQRQRAVASGSRWLGRADWMEAGQQLLMSEGIAGMRLTKLTKRLKRSEEHTSELQSLMRISYAVFCLKKKNNNKYIHTNTCTYKKIY